MTTAERGGRPGVSFLSQGQVARRRRMEAEDDVLIWSVLRASETARRATVFGVLFLPNANAPAGCARERTTHARMKQKKSLARSDRDTTVVS